MRKRALWKARQLPALIHSNSGPRQFKPIEPCPVRPPSPARVATTRKQRRKERKKLRTKIQRLAWEVRCEAAAARTAPLTVALGPAVVTAPQASLPLAATAQVAIMPAQDEVIPVTVPGGS